jgi:alpha-beta hydrolase superfamily lysophospholipase
VFYVHGIQSHAGWLTETGHALADRGLELWALDRRGSGMSGGIRGDLPSAAMVLDDYDRALTQVEVRGACPPLLLGQSFGGSVLTALLVRRPVDPSLVVLCAPALGQQRARHGEAGLTRVRGRSGMEATPIRLRDIDYSSDPACLTFMAGDRLMLRTVPARTMATMVAIEDLYTSASTDGALAHHQVHLAAPQHDPIIDLDASWDVLTRLAPSASRRVFPTDRHYLEFTEVRTAYWDWLAGLVGPARPGVS